jgi:hypothetical protein
VAAEELPWRPLTVGELLDAAIGVFRRQAVRLLAVAVGLAAVEQLALYPIRRGMFPDIHDYFSGVAYGAFDLSARWWLLVAAGIGTEAAVITMLGAVAAGPARQLLFARTPGACPRMSPRPIGTIVLGVGVGVLAFATFWAGVVPWLFCFMFTALAAPVLVADARLGRSGAARGPRRLSVPGALGRSLRLVRRSGLRPGGVRLLAYGSFTALRLLLALAGGAALDSLVRIPIAVSYALWIGVNATAYACVAAVDAAAHLEARMRLEGLDLELDRALRTGSALSDALVVPG